MRAVASLVLVLAFAQAIVGDNWAVIVAGSNGYGNYRHHADVCHAYQILKKNGLKDSNIITMLFDDVANDPENPFPGKLFNKPTSGPGVDVYAGCQKDYTGQQVTADNFISIITGDKSKGLKKVLESTAEDRVFINFVDHGGTGLIAFPVGEYLYADKLNTALQTMHSKKMYKELVFYMEACESGSMFENKLPANIKIYATTAANAAESSWGTYCPPQDVVNGKSIGSCLGDLYSVNWMEDADKGKESSETLEQQYNIVKNETTQSHVMQYGDLQLDSEPIGDYMGMGHKLVDPRDLDDEVVEKVSVKSRDAGLVSLFARYQAAAPGTRGALAKQLIAEIQGRERADQQFERILEKVHGANNVVMAEKHEPTEFDCHRAVNAEVAAQCGPYNGYSLRYTKAVVNMCEKLGGDVAPIIEAVRAVC